MRLDSDFRVDGLLIRGRDASELLDLASASLLVQTLGVTLLSDLERDVDEYLDKRDRLVFDILRSGV